MPYRQVMLILARCGLSESRVLSMTEPEVMGWLDALGALNKAAHGNSRTGPREQTHTAHIQSLRRKPRG